MDGKEKTKRIRRHGFNAYIKQYKAMLEAERKAVGSHGSFAWSTDPYHAVHNSAVPEELAFMAFRTEAMPPDISPMQQDLLDKHYLCKHGTNTYYGQTEVTFLLFTSLCQRLKGKINFLIESVRKQNRREGNPLAILLSNRYWSILRSAYCRLAGEWRNQN